MTDYVSLPHDLPRPEDDGDADHLEGMSVPAGLSLPSTRGADDSADGNDGKHAKPP